MSSFKITTTGFSITASFYRGETEITMFLSAGQSGHAKFQLTKASVDFTLETPHIGTIWYSNEADINWLVNLFLTQLPEEDRMGAYDMVRAFVNPQ